MLFDGLEKKHNKYMVGYDLGEDFSQISFASLQQEVPESVALVAGTKQYNIPTILCKKKEWNQWYFGKEAQRIMKSEEGYQVDHLLEKACKGDVVVIEEREYDPVALLTLYVKKSFSLFSVVASVDQIEILTITTENLSDVMVEVLTEVVSGLGLKTNRIYFQDHKESYYYYMLHQPEELWKGKSIILDFSKERLSHLDLMNNYRTEPIVSVVTQEVYPEDLLPIWSEDEAEKEKQKSLLDQIFLEKIQGLLSNQYVSSVYLVGEGFSVDWMKDSLQFLCRGRRVFKGNNLYSKGAAYSAMERLCPSEQSKKYIFLGSEKLKANIGVAAKRRGEDIYKPLLDAGTNWYDAAFTGEFYLEGDPLITLKITPVKADPFEKRGSIAWEESILLDGIQQRPFGAYRLRLKLSMPDVEHLHLEVEDLGFGMLYEATDKVWSKDIALEKK